MIFPAIIPEARQPDQVAQLLIFSLPVRSAASFGAPLDGGSSSGEWDSRYNFPGYLQPELGNLPGAGMMQNTETWQDRPQSGGVDTAPVSELPGGAVINDATRFFGKMPGRTVSYTSPDDLDYPDQYQPPAAADNLPVIAVFSDFLRGM